MNLRRKSRATSEVSTHSLNDIMFFLLLFFLIASTMANPAVIKVLLPKAKQTTTPMNIRQVNLIVTKDLKFYVGKDRKEVLKQDLKSSLAKYSEENKESKEGTKQDLTFVLHIDSDVPWKEVVEILDLGKELNLRMVAATDKK